MVFLKWKLKADDVLDISWNYTNKGTRGRSPWLETRKVRAQCRVKSELSGGGTIPLSIKSVKWVVDFVAWYRIDVSFKPGPDRSPKIKVTLRTADPVRRKSAEERLEAIKAAVQRVYYLGINRQAAFITVRTLPGKRKGKIRYTEVLKPTTNQFGHHRGCKVTESQILKIKCRRGRVRKTDADGVLAPDRDK